ncbi:MAG: SRPBCC family protein [Alphaproteobacteria bacterium]|nr:SRPBCC family protein [Alphaproteobacteria bacterium]
MRPRRRKRPSWDVAPPTFTFTAEERDSLAQGGVVHRAEQGEAGSAGISVCLADAPPQRVWATITDFDAYVDFLPYVTASWLETAGAPVDGVAVWRWGMELTTKGVVTRYAVESRLRQAEGYMTWEMVPRGTSPMARATGFWQTRPWADAPQRTLVLYGASVETAWWLPSPIHRKAADRGLPTMVTLIAARAAGAG